MVKQQKDIDTKIAFCIDNYTQKLLDYQVHIVYNVYDGWWETIQPSAQPPRRVQTLSEKLTDATTLNTHRHHQT